MRHITLYPTTYDRTYVYDRLIDVELDDGLIRSAQKKLSEKILKAALNKAAERALTQLKNEVAEVTARDYYISKRRIKEKLDVGVEQHWNGTTMRLLASTRRPLASSYEISPRKRPYNRMHGLYVGIKRQGGLKLIPNAFLLKDNLPMIRRKGTGGYVHVTKYDRYGHAHEWTEINTWRGLHYLYGPSVASIARNPDNLPEAIENVKKSFAKNFQHEVLYRLGVFKKYSV